MRSSSRWGTQLDREAGLTVVEIIKEAAAGRITGMFVEGENPAMSDPDLDHARAARWPRLEHLVVQDIFATETAILADVVLPASAFAEKWGSVTNTDRLIQVGRPALNPPGRARQDLWASSRSPPPWACPGTTGAPTMATATPPPKPRWRVYEECAR